MPLLVVTLLLLIVSFAATLSGCASTEEPAVFDAHWNIQGDKACLSKDDVIKLRETLIRCKTK